MTAAAVEALRDLWEADDHVTSDQFRTGLADALMKFCRGLFATTNLIYLSRQIPLLRERLIVPAERRGGAGCRVGGAAGGRGMRMPGVAMPWLVGYYGVFQAGHVVFNVVYLSGLRPIPEFPWPPAEGWHPQATAFWTATGLIVHCWTEPDPEGSHPFPLAGRILPQRVRHASSGLTTVARRHRSGGTDRRRCGYLRAQAHRGQDDEYHFRHQLHHCS